MVALKMKWTHQKNHWFLLQIWQWPLLKRSKVLLCVVQFKVLWVLRSWRRKCGLRVRHGTSSLAAAHTGLQTVLVTGSALEGFKGIREAVSEHRHLAAMAHRTRDEGVAPAGLARLGMLNPLQGNGQSFFRYSVLTQLHNMLITGDNIGRQKCSDIPI